MLPLIKIVIVTVRLSLRPLSGWMKLLARHRMKFMSPLLISFGNWTHRLEIKLNRLTINPNQRTDFYIKPLNDDAALQKGAETFAEIVFFYGLMFGLTFYELRKTY